jgi:hypothetical protein
MKTSHENATNSFSGKLNTDFDYRNVEQVDFVHSLNLRSQFGATLGARENVKGNTLVPNTQLPLGDNKVIGSVEDKQGSSLIYFVFNSLGNHTIWRYYPEEQTAANDKGVIRKVIESSVLGFQIDKKIHSACVLDNYLIWVNSTATPPRLLDLDKATLGNKNYLTYKLILDATSFVDTKIFYVAITDVDGTVIEPATAAYTADATDWLTQVDDLITGIDALGFDITVTKRGTNELLIQSDGSERCEITVDSGVEILYIEDNHYPETILDYHINLIKPVPRCAPVAKYVQSGAISNLFGYTFQFAYRYIFVDNSRSPFSPTSQIPTAISGIVGGVGFFLDAYDEVLVEINDPKLSDEGYLNLIKGIELVVRYDDRGVFRRVKYYERESLTLNDIEISFTNTGVYGAIGSDEDGTATTQVLKQFDSVPKFSEAAVVLADDLGRSRLLLGGNTEGYDIDIVADTAIVITDQVNVFFPDPAEQYNRKVLKSDGIYGWGIVYEDEYNRKAPVVPIGISNRAYTIPSESPVVEIQINHIPPSWATHYRLVRTTDQYHETYLQAVGEIDYVQIVDSQTVPGNLLHGDADITHTRLSLNSTSTPENDGDVIFMFHKLQESLAVNPEAKQFVKLLYRSADLATAAPAFDKQIVGYEDTGDELQLFFEGTTATDLKATGGFTDIWGVQIYKRKEVIDDFYYETGHCFDIVGGYHMGGERDQSNGVSARIIFIGGDTYVKILDNYFTYSGVGVSHFETPYMFLNFADTTNEDIGRANIEDENYREIVFSNSLRISDLYISDSAVNGVPSFRSGNKTYIDKTFGALTKLVLTRDVLLGVCAFKIQPFYVGKAELIDLRANTLLAGNDQLLSQGQESIRDIGSTNGESIISEDGRVHGWDSYKRLWWRYGQNGVEAISSDYLNAKKFRKLGEDIAQHGGTFVYGGFERNYKTMHVTFEGIEDSEGVVRGQTWAFEDSPLAGYIGEQSFVPEYYGKVGSHFVSFKDGGIWLHDYDNVAYCNFYGVQHPMKIEFAVHSPAPATKLFWNIRLQTNKKFIALIETYHGDKTMTSRLREGKWTRYEGTYWADFLRNISDASFLDVTPRSLRETTALLHGEQLRGDVMLIELTSVSPDIKNILYRSDVEFTVSHDTKVK